MEDDKDIDLATLDQATLINARIVFETLMTTVQNMDFIPEDKDVYLSEIRQEIDAIDVELLSRGTIGPD